MHVIALCGLPGSGKSTLARALAEQGDFEWLDRDVLRATAFPEAGGYSAADKAHLNAMMRERMLTALAAGRGVILDGMTLARAQDRAMFASAAVERGATFLLAWLDCPVELARRRVQSGGDHPAADRDPALVDAVAARFETPRDGVRLDAREPIERAVEIVLRQLHARESFGRKQT